VQIPSLESQAFAQQSGRIAGPHCRGKARRGGVHRQEVDDKRPGSRARPRGQHGRWLQSKPDPFQWLIESAQRTLAQPAGPAPHSQPGSGDPPRKGSRYNPRSKRSAGMISSNDFRTGPRSSSMARSGDVVEFLHVKRGKRLGLRAAPS